MHALCRRTLFWFGLCMTVRMNKNTIISAFYNISNYHDRNIVKLNFHWLCFSLTSHLVNTTLKPQPVLFPFSAVQVKVSEKQTWRQRYCLCRWRRCSVCCSQCVPPPPSFPCSTSHSSYKCSTDHSSTEETRPSSAWRESPQDSSDKHEKHLITLMVFQTCMTKGKTWIIQVWNWIEGE